MISFKSLRGQFSKFSKDTSGGVLIYVGFAMPVFLGLAGLAVDTSLWHAQLRGTQTMADSAVVAAALELRRGGDGDAAATRDAETNGFVASATDTITINDPPTAGDYTDDTVYPNAVEVVIQRKVGSYLSSVLNSEDKFVQARAVALVETNDSCIWALDPTAANAVTVTGSTTVNLDCGIISNSSAASSVSVGGGSTLNTTGIAAVGDISDTGGAGTINADSERSGISSITDPLIGMPPPATAPYPACNALTAFPGPPITYNGGPGEDTLYPGVYCRSITIIGGAQVTLEPGLYIMDGGGFSITAGADVVGIGVTFYFTENTGNGDGFSMTSGAPVTLHAPLDDSLGGIAGVLIYQSRDSTSAFNHQIVGDATVDLEGIIYTPNQEFTFAGNASTATQQIIVIAETVTFIGAVDLSSFGSSASISANKYMIQSVLVE